MTICLRCRRPLKNATESGLGPVCQKKSRQVPVPAHDLDLFGYDLDKAVHAARYRLQVYVDVMAAEAYIAVRLRFAVARRRLGVWA